ncbi:MAG: hypothetical protein EXS48_03425, partial [Candidatus Staskawiczbacteria bacterium]|nr:hypothetical protein [Candidatus Staskawiczbacteria bacterium]
MPKSIESQPSSEGNIPEGIPVEGALSGKDLEDLKATSKEAGDWVENKEGVLEFVKKEDSEIEAMTQSAEI